MVRTLALTATSLLLSAAAFAGTDVKVGPFSAIQLSRGGYVALRSGPAQRVTVLEGDTKVSRIVLHGNTLEITGCPEDVSCPSRYKLNVEIVSPNVEALSVHGGGKIEAVGSFSKQAVISTQVHGGGDIRTGNIPVETANAMVHGGGEITTKATTALNANVQGGGKIRYFGHPPRLVTQTHGGGEILSAD